MTLSEKLKKLGHFAMMEEALKLEKTIEALQFEVEKIKHEQVLSKQRHEALVKILDDNLRRCHERLLASRSAFESIVTLGTDTLSFLPKES
jgi:uncharacterized protein YqgQ